MKTYYYLAASSQNVQSEFRINGAPLVGDPLLRGVKCDFPINAWLVPGVENRLTVRLQWYAEMPFTAGRAEGRASVFLADPASPMPRPETVLATFAWPQPPQPEVAESYPVVREQELAVREFPPSALWREAEPIGPLSDGDREALLALTEEVRARALARDAEGTAQLMDYKIVDCAMAEYHDPVEMRQLAREQLRWIMSDDGSSLRSEALPPKEATFDVAAFNRVVLIRRHGMLPAIQVAKGAKEFGFDLFCARIGGHWRVVR